MITQDKTQAQKQILDEEEVMQFDPAQNEDEELDENMELEELPENSELISEPINNHSLVAEYDTAKFWARAELPNSRAGFIPVEIKIDKHNFLTLSCLRPPIGLFRKLLPPKPLPEGTVISLAFQNKNLFELWSSQIKGFLQTDKYGLDEYAMDIPKQEMSSSERDGERFVVSIPLTFKSTFRGHREMKFAGCELSKNGISLWFPKTMKNKIHEGETYQLTFEPKEVEAFSFELECVRPNSFDDFTNGFTAGFKFKDLDPNNIAIVRLGQLMKARGKLREINLFKLGHYLSHFWKG